MYSFFDLLHFSQAGAPVAQLLTTGTMAAQFQIFLRQAGEEPIPIDVSPTDTIKDIKSRNAGFSSAQLSLGRRFLKNASTMQEHDIKAGVTLNAFIKKAPTGFGSSQRQKAAEIFLKSSRSGRRRRRGVVDRVPGAIAFRGRGVRSSAYTYINTCTAQLSSSSPLSSALLSSHSDK